MLFKALIMSLICLVFGKFITTDINLNNNSVDNKRFNQVAIHKNPHNIQKRACIPTVKLENCLPGKENKRYTYYLYYQYTNITLGCEGTKVTGITWRINDLETMEMNVESGITTTATRVFKPDSLSPGKKAISVEVTESGGGTAEDTCLLNFVTEPPVIIFKEGYFRDVAGGILFYIDITGSKNPIKKPLVAHYTFTCIVKKDIKICPECAQTDKTDLKISYFAHACYEYINVRATIPFFETTVEGYQKIFISKLFQMQTSIKCLKNCDAQGSQYSNPDSAISLKLVCLKFCLTFGKKTPNWIYARQNDAPIPFTSSQFTKVDDYQITINPNVFGYNEEIGVMAGVTNEYRAIIIIKMARTNPTIKCSIYPKEGFSMVTIFKINCDTSKLPSVPFFSVYQTKKDLQLLLLESPYEEMNVIIGTKKPREEQQLIVTGRDIFYHSVNCTIDKVIVQSRKRTMKDFEDYFKTINKYHENDNDQRALQAIQALLLDHKYSDLSKEEKDQIFIKSLEMIDKLTKKDIYIYKEITSLLPSFYGRKEKSDEFMKTLSDVCNKLSKIQSSSLLKSRYAKYAEQEAQLFAKNLLNCADDLLKFKPTDPPISVNLTTPENIVTEPEIIEDYPNYEAININPNNHQLYFRRDQLYFRKIKNYEIQLIPQNTNSVSKIEKIRANSMNSILESSKAIAATLVEGEKMKIEQNNADIVISVDAANSLPKNSINVSGVRIKPSIDFAKFKTDSITTLATSYRNDILDYASKGIVTNILNLGFYNISNGSVAIQGPKFDIIFDIIVKNPNIDYIIARVCVPSNPNNWSTPDINYQMNVHRMNVRKGRKCLVKFSFMKSEEKFQVVITKNRRPSIKDFSKSYIIDGLNENSHKVMCPFSDEYYDSFVYLGVLPHPDMLKEATEITTCVDYSVYLTVTTCVIFNENAFRWVYSGCKMDFFLEDSEPKIKCTCNHTSIFAAEHTNLVNKLDIVLQIPIKAIWTANFIVLFHVAFVFLCYCIALSIGSFIKTQKTDVHFLSDNLKNDKYAYAIAVKTGNYRSSGTTSNICIKIFGEKNESRSHVLNYPDPERQLLQQSSIDWFVLTHDVHLGDLKSIWLWFDSIGLRPSWYCDYIRIIDLQTNKSWYFKVDAWLDLVKKNTSELVVEPGQESTENNLLKFSIQKYIHFYLSNDNTWNIFMKFEQEDLLYFQRITIILSIIYTTYVILLLLLGIPTMTTRDAFGYGELQLYWEILYFPFISSFLASIINFPFLYLIRNSEKTRNPLLLLYKKKLFSSKVESITCKILYLWIFLCMTYLLIFGYFVTIDTLYIWIISTILSILLSIFLMEQIYLIVLNIIENNVMKIKLKLYNTKRLLAETEKQRKFLFRVFGEVLMRPYFQRHYNILKKVEISKLKEHLLLRKEMADLFRDMCIFLLYITILYVICLLNTDRYLRRSNEDMVKMLIDAEYKEDGFPLEDVESSEDIFSYINTTIIEVTQAMNWYGDYNSLDAGIMVDFSTKVLGIVQLRQQRRTLLCNTSEALTFINMTCPEENKIFKKWSYDKGTGITISLGQLQYYNGGGYIAHLGRTLHNSYFIIDLLYRHKWIDINTKVLFIEFWTYNANSNIFNSIRIIFERDLSGDIITSYNIFTTRYVSSSFVKRMVLLSLVLILLLLLLLFNIRRIMILVKHKNRYFRSVWNLVDVVILILSILLIIFYFYKAKLTGDLLRKLVDAKHNEFVKYFYLAVIARVKLLISAVLICLATIRLWKFLRFGIVFRIMEKTIWDSLGTIVLLMFYQIIVFVMFAVCFHIMFGTFLESFRNMSTTMITLFLLSLGFPTDVDLDNLGNGFNAIYTLFLVCSMFFLTLNTAVIIISYESATNYFSNNDKSYNLKSYIIEEAIFRGKLLGVWCKGGRLKGGEDINNRHVYPKADSERYADCVSISENKLETMQMIALCIIRKNLRFLNNTDDLEEYDFKLMAKLLISYKNQEIVDSKKDEHKFFITKHPTIKDKRVLVPDSKLIEIEKALLLLLSDKIEERSVREEDNTPIVVSGDHLRMKYMAHVLKNIVGAINNIKIEIKEK